MKTLAAALLLPAALIAAGSAAAQTPGPRSGERATIPFAADGGLRTYEPAANGFGVYLQDRRSNWYYASFSGPCTELPFAFGIGFRTFGGTSTVSSGDAIVVRGQECRIADLVRSGPPPAHAKKPARAGPADRRG